MSTSLRETHCHTVQGGTEPWEHTARRIAMDAERISHEGQVLRDASRPAGIKRLRRILTAYGTCSTSSAASSAGFGHLRRRLAPSFGRTLPPSLRQ